MDIRTIEPKDYTDVKNLIQEAFKSEEHSDGDEAFLVERIRKEQMYQKEFDVVALVDSEIVGHGMLSPVYIEKEDGSQISHRIAALAPLAVKTNHQGRGIGRAIIEELENRAKKAGYHGISILGNPEYYQKFGYFPAKQKGIAAPFDIEDHYYLVKELTKDGLNDCQGVIHYLSAFGVD